MSGESGYFFGDPTPEELQQQRILSLAQALQQQGLSEPARGAYGGLANAGKAIAGALSARYANKNLTNLGEDRSQSYARALGNALGPSDNSAWDAGPEMDASGNPGQLQISPRVGAPLAQRLAATMNPDLIKQAGPTLLAQQMPPPITPYQQAELKDRVDQRNYERNTADYATLDKGSDAIQQAMDQSISIPKNELAQAQAAAAKAAPGPTPVPLPHDVEAQRVRIAKAGIDERAAASQGTTMSPIKIDSGSPSLNAQTGLSQFAINFLQGGPLPRGQAQQAAINKEIQDWSIANGIDTATLRSQATGINHVVQQNVIRNNQGSILEKELQGTVRTLAPIADAIGNGRVNAANLIDLWAGKQVNNPDVQQYRDQLLRLRTELAGYNAVAAGKLTEQGTPRVDESDMRSAEQVILSGINSGGLKGLQNSVGATTVKNRNVLQNSLNDANQQMWGLFGVGDNYKRTAPALNLEDTTAPPAGAPAGAPTATGANGQKLMLQNGQWVPVK